MTRSSALLLVALFLLALQGKHLYFFCVINFGHPFFGRRVLIAFGGTAGFILRFICGRFGFLSGIIIRLSFYAAAQPARAWKNTWCSRDNKLIATLGGQFSSRVFRVFCATSSFMMCAVFILSIIVLRHFYGKFKATHRHFKTIK